MTLQPTKTFYGMLMILLKRDIYSSNSNLHKLMK